jgi:hypothetical protein
MPDNHQIAGEFHEPDRQESAALMNVSKRSPVIATPELIGPSHIHGVRELRIRDLWEILVRRRVTVLLLDA